MTTRTKMFLAPLFASLTLYAATGPAHALTWTTNGPDSGEVNAVFAPGTGYVYASVQDIGVYRSTDDGATWTLPVSNFGIVYGFAYAAPYLYAVTNGAEVFRSADSGSTWEPKGSGLTSGIQSIVIVGSSIYVASSTEGVGGVYRSDDDGDTWTLKATGLPAGVRVVSLAASGTTVYAALRHSSTGGVYRSDDGGDTWTPKNVGPPRTMVQTNALAVHGASLFYSSYQNEGVYRSDDGGDTWATANSGLPASASPSAIFSTGTSLFVHINSEGVFRSDDGGASWVEKANGFFAHGTFVGSGFTVDAGVLYMATPAGVYRSNDNGELWTRASTGMRGAKIAGLAYLESTLFALELGGIFRSTDLGASWIHSSTGLGSPRVQDMVSLGGELFVARVSGGAAGKPGVYRSADAGVTWTATTAIPSASSMLTVAVLGTTLFAGSEGDGAWKSDDSGGTWTQASAPPANLYSLVVAGASLYAGTADGVYRSDDGAASWVSIGPSGAVVKDTLVVGTDLYAATWAAGGEVQVTSDGGTTWLATDLPGKAYALAAHGSTVFVGANDVFRSDDAGATWVAQGLGIITAGLTVAGDTLFAGTQQVGGVFSASLLGPEVALSDTSVDAGSVDVGSPSTVTFDVTNTGNAPLSVSDIASDDAQFTVSPTTFTTAAAASETVTVTFTPTAAGAQSASITITHDAPGSPAIVAATGTGTIPPTTVAITSPTAAQVFPPGTTAVSLAVDIAAHTDKWAWQLDTPFPASGAAGGTQLPVATPATTIVGLTDGASVTVYVTLVDAAGDVLATPVEDSVAFSVDTLPTDYMQVLSGQGGPGQSVTIPIQIYDISTLGVVGIDFILSYDALLLTPDNDGAGVTTATVTGDVVPAGWSIQQHAQTAGQLVVSMASDFANSVTAAGTLAYVTFDVAAGATPGASTPLSLSGIEINEGAITATAVDGLFTVLSIVYGDVTGNGGFGSYDAAWVLEYVVNAGLVDPIIIQFPIEITPPVWATLPLTAEEAIEVADVDDDGTVGAMDASDILSKRVGLIDTFIAEGAPATSPSIAANAATYRLSGTTTPLRPGDVFTVSFDVDGMEALRAGELLLEYDASLVGLVDAALSADGGTSSSDRPLLVQRESAGQLSLAFASARPMDATHGVVDVTFQASRQVRESATGAVRASRVRVNRSTLRPGRSYGFDIEPYRFKLMSNYPNPFNPETWIPFELSADSDVVVTIYALDGRRVRALDLGARAMGEHTGRDATAYWNGRNDTGEAVASGLYVYELRAGDDRSVRRMLLMK